MENFWDYSVWGAILLFAVLLGSLLVGNVLKKTIPFLKVSLICIFSLPLWKKVQAKETETE